MVATGYTAASERLGEGGAYELIQLMYTIMADAVRGTVQDFMGDGIMALFGVAEGATRFGAPCPACKGQVSGPSRKNVSISPFPFTSTMPCDSALKRPRTRAWVAAEIMMRLGRPCDSMRLATFTASPHTS